MKKRFWTAIADPPWPYNKASAKRGNGDGNGKQTGYVSYQNSKDDVYPTLDLLDLSLLPVGDLVQGYMFLWVAKAFVEDGFKILRAWGFEPKTYMIWHKTGSPGVGSWFMSDVEMVLVGKKPEVNFIRSKRSDFFESPRGRHSEKPPHVHELIEDLYPGPYLELFGRREREGWTVLGDEAPGDGRDIRFSLKEML